MTEPVLKSAAVSGVTRLLATRPVVAPVRRDKPPEITPYVPLPALSAAALPDDSPARAELEAARDKARKQGYEAGLAEGRSAGRALALEEAQAEQARQAQRLADLVERIEQRIDTQIDGLEALAVDVALTACRRMLGHALARPDGVAALVRTALTAARRDELVAVRLSPADLALLSPVADADWPLVADDSLKAGDCIVDVTGGSIDARLSNQFRLLADALAQAAQQPATEADA